MINNKINRYLLKQLNNLDLPFKYKLIYYDEEKDCEIDTFANHVMYVQFEITSNECNLLINTYKTQVYFWIPDDYPFTPPTIMLEDPIIHPLIGDNNIDNNHSRYYLFEFETALYQ